MMVQVEERKGFVQRAIWLSAEILDLIYTESMVLPLADSHSEYTESKTKVRINNERHAAGNLLAQSERGGSGEREWERGRRWNEEELAARIRSTLHTQVKH